MPRPTSKNRAGKSDDKEQSRLFIDKAREIEADEKSSTSDLLLGRLAKMKPKSRKSTVRK